MSGRCSGAMGGAWDFEGVDDRWIVAQSAVNKEKYCQNNLRLQGYECWFPQVWKTVRHARKQTRCLRPLFPGYVFVRLEAETSSWRPITGTRGVSKLVMMGQQPARLNGEIIKGLKSLVGADGHLDLDHNLSPGDQIKILSGNFEDWVGQVVDLPSAERVIVLLDMVSREVSVNVPKRCVVKAA